MLRSDCLLVFLDSLSSKPKYRPLLGPACPWPCPYNSIKCRMGYNIPHLDFDHILSHGPYRSLPLNHKTLVCPAPVSVPRASVRSSFCFLLPRVSCLSCFLGAQAVRPDYYHMFAYMPTGDSGSYTRVPYMHDMHPTCTQRATPCLRRWRRQAPLLRCTGRNGGGSLDGSV